MIGKISIATVLVLGTMLLANVGHAAGGGVYGTADDLRVLRVGSGGVGLKKPKTPDGLTMKKPTAKGFIGRNDGFLQRIGR